jgi:CRP-like cAMP-binding protein
MSPIAGAIANAITEPTRGNGSLEGSQRPVTYDVAQLERRSEMPQVPDVSAIAQQVKARIKQIEDQLSQHERLSDELERLRDALTRLEGAARSRVSASRRPAAKPADAPKRASNAKRASAPARAPRGQNKAKVLEALKGGPMTASEIAKVTGIGTGTVSTMLTKLAKSGELDKAERGYKLP